MVRAELALMEATPSSDLGQAKELALSALRANQGYSYHGRALLGAVVHARLCLQDGRDTDRARALLSETLAVIDDVKGMAEHLDTVPHAQELLQQLAPPSQ